MRSFIKVNPVFRIEIEDWVAASVLRVFDNGVYICTCSVRSNEYMCKTKYTFVYDITPNHCINQNVVGISFIIYLMHLFFFWGIITGRCINNTLFIWYITSNIISFPRLIVFTSPQELSDALIPRTFYVTLNATKPRTLMQGSEYFWFHKWLLPSLIYLLLQINSSPSNEKFLLSKSV